MSKFYLTLEAPAEGLYREKGSKFLAYAYPVKDVQEVHEIIRHIKSRHPKARHYCYAYRLGTEGNIHRHNDDGEPSGTAGKPILGQIDSYHLTNTLVIVVRYFGGKLLGTSGLIRSYRECAQDAINQAKIIKKEIRLRWKVAFDFSIMGILLHSLSSLPIEIEEKDLRANPYLIISTSIDGFDQTLDTLIARALQIHEEQVMGKRSFDPITVTAIK